LLLQAQVKASELKVVWLLVDLIVLTLIFSIIPFQKRLNAFETSNPSSGSGTKNQLTSHLCLTSSQVWMRRRCRRNL
jgi:uncharacterized membrane protein